MSNNKDKKEDLFKDWVPEVVEYDEEVDGGGEHLVRHELLAKKEELVDTIVKMKNKRRINKLRR
ncbi:hypothetical protein [Sulfurimonas sp. HSL-1716]|uniref:hypothetical protein n=1 Tax=Hydrocurvibacter sulfurireducens TaxID=3131937 RepID=UPI0031F91243